MDETLRWPRAPAPEQAHGATVAGCPRTRHADGMLPSRVLALPIAPLTASEARIKRVIDLVLAPILLLGTLPVMLAAAVAIKLDSPGPVLYFQVRRGLEGRGFRIWKFRTMQRGACAVHEIVASRPGDTRVTRVGRFLRRTRIDELPQLVNVIRGEMSLVGPRPHASAHDAEYCDLIARYAIRGRVKPGITGWAQIHGLRGGTSEIELIGRRLEEDLWYIDHWSPWLDFKILVRTVPALLRPDVC